MSNITESAKKPLTNIILFEYITGETFLGINIFIII